MLILLCWPYIRFPVKGHLLKTWEIASFINTFILAAYVIECDYVYIRMVGLICIWRMCMYKHVCAFVHVCLRVCSSHPWHCCLVAAHREHQQSSQGPYRKGALHKNSSCTVAERQRVKIKEKSVRCWVKNLFCGLYKCLLVCHFVYS